MTWTLRLYDANGAEIGWSTVDPLDYWVDSNHPDSLYIDAMIDMRVTETVESAPHDWVAEDGRYSPRMHEVVEDNTDPAKDRLEEAGVACVREGWADSYALADE